MRISNIAQYAGGADDVVALEVLQGNQLIKTINATGIDFSAIEDTEFDVDAELFTSTVESRSSSITITNLASAPVSTTTGVTTNPVSLTVSEVIGNKAEGSFDLKVPSTLLTQFGTTLRAAPDATNPFIVAMKVAWTVGTGFDQTTRSIRFLFVIRYQPIAS